MHNLTLTAALIAGIASPALAGGTIEFCTEVGEMAHSTMMIRQSGMPLHTVAGLLADELDGDPLEIALGLMQIAYEEPLFSMPDNKAEAAAEFSSALFVACRSE